MSAEVIYHDWKNAQTDKKAFILNYMNYAQGPWTSWCHVLIASALKSTDNQVTWL